MVCGFCSWWSEGAEANPATFTPPPTDLGHVVKVVSGETTICTINTLGSLRCWADGNWQQGTTAVPSDLGPVIDVSVGSTIACAIRAADSSIKCWGEDYYNLISGIPADLGPVRRYETPSQACMTPFC